MSDEMEERLRAVLRERAGAATVAGDPVASVRNRMRRRARRRGLAVASTAALCVAGIAIAATALAGNNTSSRPIGPTVNSSNPATTAATPTPPTSPAASSQGTATPPSSVASAVVATSSRTPSAPLPANASALALPTGYSFGSLASDSGQLVVVGAASPTPTTAGPPPCASARITSNPFAVAAPITTIHLVAPGFGCDDPALFGERVSFVVNNPDGGSPAFTSSIAIAVTDPSTGALTTGPIVMRFSEASNTRPVAAYGGGSLWIYDVDTNNGPEAIQVSATTGKLEDVVRTPQLYRPVLAANTDGLWLGNSIEGSQVAGTVFHVASGSQTVTTVVLNPNDAVDWMVADNGHVWAGIRPVGGSLLSLWRFDGPTAKVALKVPEPSLEAGPNFVVGDEQDGLWLTTPDPPLGATPSPTDNQHLDVVRFDPNTGKPTVEAALPPLDQLAAESQTLERQAAFSAGNYFLLQSPSVGGYTGFTQLLRVTPLP